MEKVNAFDVIKRMSADGSKHMRLAPLSNIVAVDQKGKRCTITIGVEAEDIVNQMAGTVGYGGLLLIDRQAFRETEEKILQELSDRSLTAEDYEDVLADHRRLVRELDVIVNGVDGAAQQASLCDLVGQIKGIMGGRQIPKS